MEGRRQDFKVTSDGMDGRREGRRLGCNEWRKGGGLRCEDWREEGWKACWKVEGRREGEEGKVV